MQKRLMPVAAAALALSLVTPVYAQDDTPNLNTVVAEVNGEIITLGHIAVAKATLPEQYRQLPNDVLFRGILDQLVQQTVLAQSFEGELPTRITLQMDNEKRSLIAGEVVNEVLAGAATPEEIEELYQKQFVEAVPGKEYNAAHILVETEEAAEEITELLEKGAEFAIMARERSTGPSGPNGGNLGWFTEGMMVPEFEQVVVSMEPGQVSDPVKTQFGWHIIKLNDVRTADAPKLEEVRDQIVQELRQKAVEDHIASLEQASEINKEAANDIDPAILDQINILE